MFHIFIIVFFKQATAISLSLSLSLSAILLFSLFQRMLRPELCVRTLKISGFDQPSLLTHSLTNPNSYRFSLHCLNFPTPKKLKSALISCKNHSHGRFFPKSHNHQPNDDYLEASLLISETVKHYHLRKQGFKEEVKQFSGQFVPFSPQVKDLRNDVNSIGMSILRRFRHPTIFLKISCEGDFLLPIVVGDFAVEKLIDSLDEDDHEDISNQFQFVRNLAVELGHEIKMVKITKRVVNTYFARIYIGKVGESEIFSVDARPSDAINVAKRCKAPIYVHKQIFLMDAIRITYWTGRVRERKPVYDVLLDSPIEGPDLLVEEFNLILNMKLAVEEERYNDAAKWRDKLVKLRNSGL